MTTFASEDRAVEEQQRRRRRRDASVVGSIVGLFSVVRLLHGVSWWFGLIIVLAGVASVRPRVLVIGLVLLLGARSGVVLDGLEAARSRPLTEVTAVLISDPREGDSGWSAQADVRGERVVLNARIGVAPSFGGAAVGDALVISGSLRGSEPETSWSISRRIVGSVTVSKLHERREASGVIGAANALRSAYRGGVRHFNSADRALFTGLVFGDDRNQDPIDADNFRASGLSHALAVSGQNVAFVLLLAAPILRRVRWAPARVGASIFLLLGFGFLTRFEASVTRAIVMAGLALIAHSVGRQSDAAVVLPPAVAFLFALDPLFAWSLAFQLSVAATVGMVVLAPRIAVLLPGPEILRLTVAATLGAQLFVAPLLLGTFGRVSLVAVPANVLAGPAVAGVMMWGLVAGPIAALVPAPIAMVLHVPTWLMVQWVAGVADAFASLPVGHFSGGHLVVGVIGLLTILVARESRGWLGGLPSRLGVGLLIVSVAIPLLVPRPLGPGVHRLSTEVTVARSVEGHDLVVLDAGADVSDTLEQLRTSRLGRIDLLIATNGSRQTGFVVHTLSNQFEITTIWAPPGHSVPGAEARPEFAGTLGSLEIIADPSGSIHIASGG